MARAFTRAHRWVLRRTNGQVLGTWFGAPVLLLEVVGRRSGLPRETPLIYLLDGDTPVVLAANAGAPRPPAWWLNLRAAGTGWVRLRGAHYQVRARELTSTERTRAWREFGRRYPAIDDYARFTTRDLPLIALERV